MACHNMAMLMMGVLQGMRRGWPGGTLIEFEGSRCPTCTPEEVCNRVALALKLERSGLYMRAALEEWSLARIVEELR